MMLQMKRWKLKWTPNIKRKISETVNQFIFASDIFSRFSLEKKKFEKINCCKYIHIDMLYIVLAKP